MAGAVAFAVLEPGEREFIAVDIGHIACLGGADLLDGVGQLGEYLPGNQDDSIGVAMHQIAGLYALPV